MLKKSKSDKEPKLFEVDLKLEHVLNKKHPLYVLANEIDWASFEKEFSPLYSENGRPAAPIPPVTMKVGVISKKRNDLHGNRKINSSRPS